MNKDEALRQALEGFENIKHHFDTDEYAYEVAVKSIATIKQALKETPRVSTEPEPVAWMRHDGSRVTTAADRKNYPDYETRYPIPLYTSPQRAEGEAPKREWQGLTDDERNDCLVEADPCECLATPEAEELMRCIEAKLKQKNGFAEEKNT